MKRLVDALVGCVTEAEVVAIDDERVAVGRVTQALREFGHSEKVAPAGLSSSAGAQVRPQRPCLRLRLREDVLPRPERVWLPRGLFEPPAWSARRCTRLGLAAS